MTIQTLSAALRPSGPIAQAADQAPPVEDGGAGEAWLDTAGDLLGQVVGWLQANGVDGVGLVLLTVFALLGAWRGLWWQVVRLIGLLGAILAARTLAPDVAAWIEGRWSDLDGVVVGGVSWLVVFVAALVLVVLLGRLGKRLLEALKLSMLDRLGGALAGVATGALLHAAAVAVLMQLTPRIWSDEHLAGTRSADLVELLGDRASVLFDSSTALALEERAGQGDAGTSATDEP